MKYEEDKYYHVYNRGANKNQIFITPDNYQYCIQLFQKYYQQYGVRIYAYCLMPNHYHLLIGQRHGGSVSRFIQTVFNAYTQAFNKIFKRSGTLFQGRVQGIEITTDEYAVRLCRYIHNNPVAARLAAKPEEWMYSDYRVWVDKTEDPLTSLNLRDGYFKSGSEYKKFMEEYDDHSEIKKYTFE